MTLISVAEVGLIARDHVLRLTPAERRRLITLVRTGRGRRRHLSETERTELGELVAKLEPRILAGEAVDRLSPVPVPKRLIQGRKRRRGR